MKNVAFTFDEDEDDGEKSTDSRHIVGTEGIFH